MIFQTYQNSFLQVKSALNVHNRQFETPFAIFASDFEQNSALFTLKIMKFRINFPRGPRIFSPGNGVPEIPRFPGDPRGQILRGASLD